MNHAIVIGIGGVCLMAGSAFGQLIQPVAQSREVEFGADASDFSPNPEMFDNDGDLVSAPDFGLFDMNIGGSAFTNAGSGSGSASQVSIIGDDSIMASGVASGAGDGGFGGSGSGFGSSNFSVTFDLMQAVDYTMSWSIGAFGIGNNGIAGVSLVGPGGTVISSEVDNSSDDDMAMGTLMPGQYTISAWAGGSGFGDEFFISSSSDGSFDLNFSVVPAPSTAALLAVGGISAIRRRR